MKNFLSIFLIIFFLNSSVEAETVVHDKPIYSREKESAETAESNKSNEPEENEVYLPPMEVPSIIREKNKSEESNESNQNPNEGQNQNEPPESLEPPNIPDYSMPDVKTEPSTPPATEPTPKLEEAEGLEFKMINRDGVMAFAVIADHEKYQMLPVLARDKVPGRATVKQMSNEYNAIAAINASYFSLGGEILGNTKINGVTAGTTYFTRSTIGINSDGSTIFGRTNYYGNLTMGGVSLAIGGVDCERGADSVVIYNIHQGNSTGTNDFGVEYIVVDNVVTNIFVNKGNNQIPNNGFVVSAHGKAAELFKNIQIGDEVQFEETIIDVDNAGNFDEAVQVIGAGPTLVKNGAINVTVDIEKFPSDIRVGRAPRSAVGVTKYGDYIFAIVDGRQAHSKGCTLQEWASILLNDFGAVNAINLDGGGSTELVVKGDIVNSPSDGHERPVGDALIIIPRN